MPRTRIHDIEILWDYYQRHQVPQPGGCIHWDAGRHRQGYGMCGAWRVPSGTKIMVTTHRIAARIAWDRPLTPQDCVIHTCGNMRCMNPEHLVLGDREMIQRQRRRNRLNRG